MGTAEQFESMNDDIRDRLLGLKDRLHSEVAEHFATQEVEKRVESGDLLELTDEEIRLIKAFRLHVARCAPKTPFRWVPLATELIVTPPADGCLIIDPQAVPDVPNWDDMPEQEASAELERHLREG